MNSVHVCIFKIWKLEFDTINETTNCRYSNNINLVKINLQASVCGVPSKKLKKYVSLISQHRPEPIKDEHSNYHFQWDKSYNKTNSTPLPWWAALRSSSEFCSFLFNHSKQKSLKNIYKINQTSKKSLNMPVQFFCLKSIHDTFELTVQWNIFLPICLIDEGIPIGLERGPTESPWEHQNSYCRNLKIWVR